MPIARAELHDNSSVLFKMVSMGAIGAMGTSADLPLLESYHKSSDTRLAKAAGAAIGKITGVRTTNGVKSLKKSVKQ